MISSMYTEDIIRNVYAVDKVLMKDGGWSLIISWVGI